MTLEPAEDVVVADSRPHDAALIPEAEPIPEPAPAQWHFTLLVVGGHAPALNGANAYYELALDGDQATVSKVGQRGTPRFDADDIESATGKLVFEPYRWWDGAEVGQLDVELNGHRVVFDFWRLGDELHGSFASPDPKGMTSRRYGLLRGGRGPSDAAPLTDGEDSPCNVCDEAYWVCGGMGNACNTADLARRRCSRRLGNARARDLPLPRGCEW